MQNTLSRRGFVAASGAAAAAGLMAQAGLGAGAARADEAAMANVVVPAGEASSSYEADVVVVGLGASGLLAAHGAAAAGAKVVALDAAESMVGVTNVRTSGAWGVGSSLQKQFAEQLTLQQAMDHINDGTNYQSNQKALRAALGSTGRAVDALSAAGMEWTHAFDSTGDDATINNLGVHWYGLKGEDRAAVFSNMMEQDGVECFFGCTAQSALFDGDGNICGVQAVGPDGELVDFRGRAVVMCTGGFLGNPQMVAELFAGAEMVCMGNATNKGAGIKLAQQAGAQIGKCFSISMNEYGGANTKASITYAFRPDTCNDAMRLPVFGGLLVDAEGGRFINEGFMCERCMFAAEPVVREGYHYAIADAAFMNRLATEPVSDFYGDARMKGMFDGVVLSDLLEQFEAAVEEGWAFKADTLAEVAEHFDLVNLEATVEEYNGYCENGSDEQFFKDAAYLNPVAEGPFYVVQSMPAGWLSLGGIKTNAAGQALDAHNHAVVGLYVAGADADLFTSPYYQMASCNGFCLGSGIVTGEAAAAYALA